MRIGDVLTRDDATKWRLVGVHNGGWTAAPAEGFGPVVTLTPDELSTRFEGASGPPEPGNDQDGWNALAESYAGALAAAAQADRGPSPEERFAAVTAEFNAKRKRTR